MTLEERLQAIEERNKKVSLDKSWETSVARRASICAVTYLCASVIFLFVIPNTEWYLAALVPVMGYMLSTLGLPSVRRLWEKHLN